MKPNIIFFFIAFFIQETIARDFCYKDEHCSFGYCDKKGNSNQDGSVTCSYGKCRCPKGTYRENFECVKSKIYIKTYS